MSPEDYGMKLNQNQYAELATILAATGEVKVESVGVFNLNSYLASGWKVVAHRSRFGTYMFLVIKRKG